MIPGIIASVRTAVAPAVPDFHAYGADTDGWIRGIVTGDGSLTFARSSTATVTDWEGLVKTVLANELRIKNARRVENLAASTASPSTQNITVVSGNEYQVRIGATSAGSSTAVCSDAFTGTLTGDAADPQAFDTAKTATSTTLTVTITGSVTDLQVEDVTGQTNQNPSEYVSVGVESGDYHGVGVDGVADFEYENGNTVSSNVVTEAKGSDLTTTWGALYESFATTNYCIYSEDLSNAAWVASNITKSSDGVTTPKGPAGTAETLTASAGNGTLLQSITLASAANNFSVYLQRKTGTGNIDITLDNGATWTTKTLTGVGTWDRVDVAGAAAANPIVGIRIVTSADAVQMWGGQLATATVPSSYIPTTTVAVTRTADDGTPSFDSTNFSDTEGTWIISAWFSDMVNNQNTPLWGTSTGTATNCYKTKFNLRSYDGTGVSDAGSVFSTVDNLYRCVIDFGTSSTLEVGARDVDGAGSWVWDLSPVSYDGAFGGGNINITRSTNAYSMVFRDFYGYKTRQGKTFIEANY